MKKCLLLGLLTIPVLCLTACWTKTYEMSFEDAINAANKDSELQDLILSSDSIEQSFNASSFTEISGANIDVNVNYNEKKTASKALSDWTLSLGLNLKWDTNASLNLAIDTKTVDNNLYLNVSNLEITGDEELESLGSLGDGFKNQRFFIPLSWSTELMNWIKSYIESLKDYNAISAEFYINEWQEVYNWKFTDYQWYNARKFSLDEEKIKDLIHQYYELLDNTEEIEIPEVSIENFEWYLVITDKDKVTTIIENMIVSSDEISMTIDVIEWDGIIEFTVASEWQDIIEFSAKKEKSHYNINFSIPNIVEISWNITPKISSSKINVDYNMSINIISDIETKTISSIPLKGSRNYAKINGFQVEAPENARDLTTLLESYLWGAFGSIYDEEDSDLDIYELDSTETDYNEFIANWESVDTIENDSDEGMNETVWIANPASVYCEENWGILSIGNWENGEYWICTFSNWNSCEERAFYRGECSAE